MSIHNIAEIFATYGPWGVFTLVVGVWAAIAIRDKGSSARKLFEFVPRLLVMTTEYVGSAFASAIADRKKKSVRADSSVGPSKEKESNPRTRRRAANSTDTDELTGEFWEDAFTLNGDQLRLYQKIAAAMPPT